VLGGWAFPWSSANTSIALSDNDQPRLGWRTRMFGDGVSPPDGNLVERLGAAACIEL
jgi:hypothetical protein